MKDHTTKLPNEETDKQTKKAQLFCTVLAVKVSIKKCF